MTGFTSIAHYSPWLVLVTGGFGIAGILGIGNVIGRLLRLPQPWLTIVGAIAADEVITVVVELMAIAHLASRPALIGVFVTFSAIGSVLLVWRRPGITAAATPFAYAAGAILIINLLIAICPSTKGDEIYYHMIVPSRIVQDGGLLFYREPLRAAIYPQMAFQMGLAPFHAIGLPDAGNVISWLFGVLLVWFAYRIVKDLTGSYRWAGLVAAAIVAGTYTSIWHVTSGAHAIGDLAVSAAVIGLYTIGDLTAQAGAARTALALGILAAAAASTKVLLFPLALAVVLIAVARLGRRYALLLLLPGILFVGPLMIWTACHSGSPLGPLLEGSIGPSPYRAGEVRDFLDDYVAGPRGPILEKLRNEAVNFSPLLWIAMAAFVIGKVSVSRTVGIGLLVIQLVLILGWNTFDARYLGGVQYALLILVAIFLTADARERILSSRGAMSVVAALIVPWMLLQLVYAGRFLRFVTGFDSKTEFYSRNVLLFGDFVALDRVLPRTASLLAWPFALDSIYAPRPIYYHVLDVPPGKEIYLLSYWSNGETVPRAQAPEGFMIGERIYEDRDAIVATFRTPGQRPRHGIVQAWRLIEKSP
ncbi:MAG: hypothetical protein M3041_12715 [Acidobacteriota bacterium]|nr:hypothetical protein [Acidobacteriota bacterium]